MSTSPPDTPIMHRYLVPCGAALFLILGLASHSHAQERSSLFGVAGGVTFAVGDLADDFDPGFHMNGALHADRVGSLPFGLRGEIGYQAFSQDDDSLRHIVGRVNAVLPVWTRPDAQPYLIGGVGLYNSKEETDHGDHVHGGETEYFAGINVGIGIRWNIGGLKTLVEARFHHVFDDVHAQQFIPFSIGVLF